MAEAEMPMRICFFIYRFSNHFDGVVRPFLNWARELPAFGIQPELVLVGCGQDLLKHAAAGGLRFRSFRTIEEAGAYVRKSKPALVMSDDSMRHLRTLPRLKKLSGARTAVYVQVLFGMHSLGEVFHLHAMRPRTKMFLGIARLIPFSLLKDEYRKLLRKNDLIIAANSATTSTFLHVIYGIEPWGVVYPPIDLAVFRRKASRRKSQALLYLGSYGGDTEAGFMKRLCSELEAGGTRVVAFGNVMMGKKLAAEAGIEFREKMDDLELAKLYSESRVTICPQKWETFGYVAAESMACGTPVMGYGCMGLAELVGAYGNGILADRKEDFIGMVRRLDSCLPPAGRGGRAEFAFGASASAGKLASLIMRACGEGRD
jgi:glycosyltransferase involved in cell wall biosynthesis